MSIQAVRHDAIQRHWSSEDKSLSVSDPGLKNIIATAMDMSVPEFERTMVEISNRKKEIRRGVEKVKGIETEVRRLREVDPFEGQRQLQTLEGQIVAAEEGLPSAMSEEGQSLEALQLAEAEKTRICSEYSDIVWKLKSAQKALRQKLEARKRVLDPQKARALENYQSAVRVHEGAQTRAYQARMRLESLRAQKEKCLASSELNAERLEKICGRLDNANAEVVILQQNLDRYIQELIEAKLSGEDAEDFKQQAEFFFRFI